MYRKLLPTTVVREHLRWRLLLMVISSPIAAVLFVPRASSSNPAAGMPMYGSITAVSNAVQTHVQQLTM